MSEPSWEELQRLWTSLPPQAAPDAKELLHMRTMRMWMLVGAAGEVLTALAGFAAGIWFITRGGAFFALMGAATIAFTTVVSALSIWARMQPRARLDDAVAQAVADAVRSARTGVRMAAATIFGICAGMGFTAILALGRGLLARDVVNAGGYIAIGIVELWLMLWLLFAFLYYRKRSADLARLESIAASLEDD